MTKTIGIFGTSGFARETADVALDQGFTPIFIARDETELEAWRYSNDVMLESKVGQHKDMVYAIGIGENNVRQRVANRYLGSCTFVSLIHSSSTFGVGQREQLASVRGAIVCAGVRFTNHIKVGNFSIFNLNSTVGHDSLIDEYVNIAPGACVSGNVHIESRCWIGTGAVINQGSAESKLKIGEDTVIGSGSVVVKSCAPNAVYVGIPAKRIK